MCQSLSQFGHQNRSATTFCGIRNHTKYFVFVIGFQHTVWRCYSDSVIWSFGPFSAPLLHQAGLLQSGVIACEYITVIDILSPRTGPFQLVVCCQQCPQLSALWQASKVKKCALCIDIASFALMLSVDQEEETWVFFLLSALSFKSYLSITNYSALLCVDATDLQLGIFVFHVTEN